MKVLTFLSCLTVLGLFAACNQDSSTTSEQTTETETTEAESIEEVAATEASTANKAEMMAQIDEKRKAIEAQLSEAIVMEIDEHWREKVRQKWAKIHVYTTEEGQVNRVKTYPHEGISKRTEEFYFENGQLMLAVIEDDGSGERGKSNDELDKMYYFQDGMLIGEVKADGEQEYNIRESDAEELLQEAMEYLQHYEAVHQ
jgi:hypothetical protein